MGDREYVFLLLDDVPRIVDPDAIHMLGIRVASLVHGGKRVVVNCAAGLNRSGLIVGRALMVDSDVRPERTGDVRSLSSGDGSIAAGLVAWYFNNTQPRIIP